MDIFRTLIVPADQAPLAREIATALSQGGVGMWQTPLAATDDAPPTHYVSTGWIPEGWQYMVPTQYWEQQDGVWIKTGETPGDPVAVYYAAVAAGIAVTQADVDALFAIADVTEQEPDVAYARLGLMITASELVE